jgi:hypothetical protein
MLAQVPAVTSHALTTILRANPIQAEAPYAAFGSLHHDHPMYVPLPGRCNGRVLQLPERCGRTVQGAAAVVGDCCCSHQVLDSSCSGWAMGRAMQHLAGHVMACMQITVSHT